MSAAHPNAIARTQADIDRLQANIAKVEARTEAIRAKDDAAALREHLEFISRINSQLADLVRIRDKMASPEYAN